MLRKIVSHKQKDIKKQIFLVKEKEEESEFKVYNYRYFICFLYILSDLSNTIQSSVFSVIAASLVEMYDIQPITASMSSYLYLVTMPFVTPLANYVIDKYGMSTSVKIGICFTVFGSWLKVGVNEYFEIVLIGTIFISMGGPFIINAKTQCSAKWFRPKSWPTVTLIVSFVSLINSIIGITVPGIWFSGYDRI